jgi:hypothetical protein
MCSLGPVFFEETQKRGKTKHFIDTYVHFFTVPLSFCFHHCREEDIKVQQMNRQSIVTVLGKITFQGVYIYRSAILEPVRE